mmetsp:Transcript_11273/g.24842  ORF Transcript_11273/g.24842 Transcript_11273/m.24842 type:complete len:97 (+) Transcript_11273:1497-1787(+)
MLGVSKEEEKLEDAEDEEDEEEEEEEEEDDEEDKKDLIISGGVPEGSILGEFGAQSPSRRERGRRLKAEYKVRSWREKEAAQARQEQRREGGKFGI